MNADALGEICDDYRNHAFSMLPQTARKHGTPAIEFEPSLTILENAARGEK